MEKRGLVNVYECKCGKHVVTINLCTGVTPANAPCPFCAEAMGMWSRWYNLTAFSNRNPLQVTHAWYRPTMPSIVHAHPAELEHVQQGGLLLGPLKEVCQLTDPEPEGEGWGVWGPWLEARYGKVEA